ncbi:hypothetical protein EG19_05045 [Thermoanaerobaculum aquaticum]|uniref:Lipoprotein n=1 Tax=Thermoanaerobaculum aquaticum TaxID=1312852 RepID=A0A062XVZ5_9BACT|nr:DUF3426 domain-containing protein [Thermoanaerobaculum aquaticum]KDA53569.1 hypothetical protein EG19_05045 [Thermoanaerobaculum aquaticum]
MKGNPALGLSVALAALALVACGSKETPEQKVTRLRLAHQVQPTAVQVRTTPEGPELLIDFTVVNTAREKLPTLTVKVVLVDSKGKDRATHLVSLSTADLLPGVAGQVTGFIRGETLSQGEQVRVEVEAEVPVKDRARYPEYRDVL